MAFKFLVMLRPVSPLLAAKLGDQTIRPCLYQLLCLAVVYLVGPNLVFQLHQHISVHQGNTPFIQQQRRNLKSAVFFHAAKAQGDHRYIAQPHIHQRFF